MGAIKDLTELTEKLANSVQDRRFAGELLAIQRAVAAIQTEQASIVENNIELMKKNGQVQQEIQAERTKVKELEEKLRVRDEVEFDGELYWMKTPKPDGKKDGPFCQKCYDSTGKPFRLQNGRGRGREWRCLQCSNLYGKDYPQVLGSSVGVFTR